MDSGHRKQVLYRIGWLDGRLVNARKRHVRLDSPSLNYGIAVFEGVIGYPMDGGIGIVALDAHCERLFAAAGELRYLFPERPRMRFSERPAAWTSRPVTLTSGMLREGIADAIRANKVREPVYIRPVLFHEGNGDVRLRQALAAGTHLGVFLQRWSGYLPCEDGVRCAIAPWRKASAPFAERKCAANYALAITAKVWALGAGQDEAIMLDEHGHVAEGTSENLIIELKGGRLVTPRLKDRPILPGITLRILRETVAPSAGLVIEEADVTAEMLYDEAEGFVLTGTAAEVRHASMLHDVRRTSPSKKVRVYNGGKPTERLQALIDGYRLLIRGEGPEAYRDWLTIVRP